MCVCVCVCVLARKRGKIFVRKSKLLNVFDVLMVKLGKLGKLRPKSLILWKKKTVIPWFLRTNFGVKTLIISTKYFSPQTKKEGLWAKDAKNVGIGWRGI